MNQEVLSVSIPSNNKTEYLIQSISKFIELKKKIPFELCVSDNSKVSRIFELSKKIKNFSKHVNYHHNSSINSMSDNFDNAVKIAKNKFVWIFGDDDIPLENSISQIIEIINTKNVEIIITNSSSFHNKNKVIEENRMPHLKDIFFSKKDNDSFMISLINYINFISSIIINKKSWLEAKIKHKNEFFFHVQKVLSIKIKSNAYFISNPLVKMRVFSQTWKNEYFYIWMINWPEVIWQAEGYDEIIKNEVVIKKPINNFKNIISKKAYGYFDYHIFIRYIKNDSELSFFKKNAYFLISILPRIIFTYLYCLIIILGYGKNNINFSRKLSLVQLLKKN